MKLKTLLEECNAPTCFYTRNKTNIMLADTVKNAILLGSGRLKEPLRQNNISILKIFDAIKSQECIKVINYKPDDYNKHLKTISLGPSYLEQQISRAIDKAVKQKSIPKIYVPYLRAEIGLDKEEDRQATPKMTPKMKQMIIKQQMAQKRQLKEEIEKQIQDLPDVHVSIDIPPSRQAEHFSCGATVIQMVAVYYGHNVRESDLIEKLGVTSKSGVKLSKIQEVAKEIGLKTNKSKLSYENILQSLENKIPLVVAILREGKDYHHFVLAIGYYSDGIIFRDPAKFTYSYLPKEEFEQKAFGSDGKFLTLALYSDEKPQYSPNEIEKV